MTHIPNVRPGALTGLGGGAPLIPTLATPGSLEPTVAELGAADAAKLDYPDPGDGDGEAGPDVLAVPIAYTEDDDDEGVTGRSYSEWLPTSIDADTLDDLLAGVDPDGTVGVLVRLRDDGLIEVRAVPEGEPDEDDEDDEPPTPEEPDDTYGASYPAAGSIDDVKAWVGEAQDDGEEAERRAFALRSEQDRAEPRKTLVAWLD